MTVEAGIRMPVQETLSPTSKSVEFEGINIQWEKGKWEFNHPELGKVIKPTYPILNPKYWGEIADLLKKGKTAAGMMMGPYGVFKKLDSPKNGQNDNSADNLFEKVKQRPKEQNFVALVHPEDIAKFVDQERLQEPYRTQFLTKEGRLGFYAGPQHVILPVKEGSVNEALVKQADQTIACFWVPGHYGFEGLVREAKKRIGNEGILGGGSLNIHGKDPHYDKESLYTAMAEQRGWLEEIDFILVDDIAEVGDIGRSHTMTRYVNGQPEVVRIGSLSLKTIKEATGHDLILDEEKLERGQVKFASSKTPYSLEQADIVDGKVRQILERTQRFKSWISSRGIKVA